MSVVVLMAVVVLVSVVVLSSGLVDFLGGGVSCSSSHLDRVVLVGTSGLRHARRRIWIVSFVGCAWVAR